MGRAALEYSPESGRAHRSERETAARISQEIGDLMKEIETLVEEKTKESLDVSRLTREGERAELGLACSCPISWAAPGSLWASLRVEPTWVRTYPGLSVLPNSPLGLPPWKSPGNWCLVKK